MTYKELKNKYKGYNIIAYGKPLINKEHMIPFSYTHGITDWNKAIVLDYEVEEYDKPHEVTYYYFTTMKPHKTEYEIGVVYAYIKKGDE